MTMHSDRYPADGGAGDWAGVLAGFAPGPRLAQALAGIPPVGLSARELVAVVQGWERLKAFVEARQLQAMAELLASDVYRRCDHPQDSEVPHVHRAVEPCGDELSLALWWSPGRAKARLVVAEELVEVLPDTWQALEAGRIDGEKARLICDRTRCLDDFGLRRGVEAAALAKAARLTRGQLDRLLRRLVLAADPAAAEQRRAVAAEGRRVSRPVPASDGGLDGMAFMEVYGPVEDLTALYTAVDAAARHLRANEAQAGPAEDAKDSAAGVGGRRTLEQVRFDVLTGLGWTALDRGHLGCCQPACAAPCGVMPAGAAPTRAAPCGVMPAGGTPTRAALSGVMPAGAVPPDAVLTRAVPTRVRAPQGDARPVAGNAVRPSVGGDDGPVWLGRQHGRAATVQVTVAASTLVGADEQPGWLDGFGPVTAATARRIAGEGVWRRLLTDPASGEVLEYGRATYTPPARLAAHVIARDRTCRFPTCEHPARDAEIDHKHPYAAGGTTGAGNCWTLHKGHHVGKTRHRFQVHTDVRGVTWWTTPAGYHYRVHPEIVGPLQRSQPPQHHPDRSGTHETPPF